MSDNEEKKLNEEYEIEDIPPVVHQNKNVLSYKNKKRAKILVITSVTALLLISVILVSYLSGVKNRMNVFEINTTINGVDVSGKTVDEAKSLVYDACSNYSMKIRFKNGEELLRVGDADLDITFSDDFQDLFDRQNPYEWIFHIGSQYTYEIGYQLTYSDEEIKKYIDTFPEMDKNNMEQSKDAEVAIIDGEVVVTPDEEGTELNRDKVYSAVLNGLANGTKYLDIEEGKCYIPADIVADSELIKQSRRSAEDFLAIEATYSLKDIKVTVTPEDLCKMAYIDDEGKVAVDRKKVSEYIESIAGKFPQETGVSKEVLFETHDGRNIKLKTKTTDWHFDIDYEAEFLYKSLADMKGFEKEPRYISEDETVSSDIQAESTYIEVDLEQQQVFFYNNGMIVFAPYCVSGCTAWGMETPAGFYVMGESETDARLVGAGNSYDIRVAYWMPFIDQEIGLHDASWRGRFGGDIYKYDGSHGCINLSLSDAQKLYSMVYEGLPVVIY